MQMSFVCLFRMLLKIPDIVPLNHRVFALIFCHKWAKSGAPNGYFFGKYLFGGR